MNEINELRRRIDKIDSGILKLLEERWAITNSIGRIKRRKGVEYYDPDREEEIIRKLTSKTKLNRTFVEKTFKSIIRHCRKDETKESKR